MGTDEKYLDTSMLDQLSQEFDDEITNLIFRDEEQSSKFDDAADAYCDAFLDSMKQSPNKEIASTYQQKMKCRSDSNNIETSLSSKIVDMKDMKHNAALLDVQHVCSTKDQRHSDPIAKNYINKKEKEKSNSLENSNFSPGLVHLSRTRTEIDLLQSSNYFDEAFEPIHSDKILLHVIDDTFTPDGDAKNTSHSNSK